MQPRTLESILSELDNTAGYGAQTQSLRKQQALIPGQIADEEKGLQARQGQAFDDILGGARRRGMGFSGIPLQEQAKYTSTEFLPAMAQLRQQGRQQAHSLEDAILGIQERRTTAGLGIRQNEQQMAEQQRQFNENLNLQRAQADASRGINPTLGVTGQANVAQRKDKGYDFKDPYGNPISAAAYAAATGIPFRQLLQTMANQGDVGARQALGFVGDDFGYDSTKIGNNAKLYNDLVWGMGKSANPNALRVSAPAAKSGLRVR